MKLFCAFCLNWLRKRNEPANGQGKIQRALGLRWRKLLDSNNQNVRTRIQEELDESGFLSDSWSMWHTLHREGYQVSRQAVPTCLQEMDPEGAIEGRISREEFTLNWGGIHFRRYLQIQYICRFSFFKRISFPSQLNSSVVNLES